MPEGDVSRERLTALLSEGSESGSLEFVEVCDLDERRDIVELATEVGALAARGGWIVVGVDDRGKPTGKMDARKADLLDEATVRDKLNRYLPPSVELRVGRHALDAGEVVLISVGAHADGAVVFLIEGTSGEGKKTRTAFRKGDLFVRHGTKSERPTQDDISAIGSRAVERAQVWLSDLHQVEEVIAEIGRLVTEEMPRAPGGRFGAFGMITRVPAARRRLAGRLAALEAAGGPSLTQCRDLAGGSHFTHYLQIHGAIFPATDEIARAFEQRV